MIYEAQFHFENKAQFAFEVSFETPQLAMEWLGHIAKYDIIVDNDSITGRIFAIPSRQLIATVLVPKTSKEDSNAAIEGNFASGNITEHQNGNEEAS